MRKKFHKTNLLLVSNSSESDDLRELSDVPFVSTQTSAKRTSISSLFGNIEHVEEFVDMGRSRDHVDSDNVRHDDNVSDEFEDGMYSFAVTYIQAHVRGMLARQKFRDIQSVTKKSSTNDLFDVDRTISNFDVDPAISAYAATIIAARIRGALARKRLMKNILDVPHIVLVKVHGAKHLMKVGEVFSPNSTKQRRPSVLAGFMSNFGTGLPDAFVLVNGLRNRTSSDKVNPCYSTAKTLVVAGSVDPQWEEELRLSMVGTGFLVLNVFSKGVMSEDIFLGQAHVDLKDHQRDLLAGRIVRLDDVSVSFGVHKVFNQTGSEIEVPDIEPHGTISISISIPSVYLNMCGAMYDIQTNLIGAVSGEAMWVVLCEDTLYCYDNQYEQVLHRQIARSEIASVTEIEIKKLEIAMSGIHLKLRSGELLEWAWGNDARSTKGMWIRAFTTSTVVLDWKSNVVVVKPKLTSDDFVRLVREKLQPEVSLVMSRSSALLEDDSLKIPPAVEIEDIFDVENEAVQQCKFPFCIE